MEEDNFKPDCDNIRKNIKSFNEDMLKEEEYKDFLDHLEACPECKKYVRSVDSFSNQLWRLGDIKVPSDFESTVLFQLTQPQKKPKKKENGEESVTGKRWLIGGVTIILVAFTISAGLISYFKLKKSPEEEVVVVDDAPVIEEQVAQAPSLEEESDVQFDQFNGIAAVFDEPQEEIAFGVVDLSEPSQEEAALEPEVDLGPTLLHWHFLHYDKTKELEALRSRRQKRKVESELRKLKKESEQLGAEVANQRIGPLEEEIRQIELQLEQNLVEKRRREGEPLNIIKSLNIRPDYQDNDFLFFSTRGDGLKSVLDKIDLISEGSSSLKDFTPGASFSPSNEYKVSVYILKKETNVLHWHVHLTMLNQKLQLIRAIEGNGGDITYEFAEEVTFSIANSNVDKIRAQMPAMRISLSEYGNPAIKSGESSETEERVVISIYFTK